MIAPALLHRTAFYANNPLFKKYTDHFFNSLFNSHIVISMMANAFCVQYNNNIHCAFSRENTGNTLDLPWNFKVSHNAVVVQYSHAGYIVTFRQYSRPIADKWELV